MAGAALGLAYGASDTEEELQAKEKLLEAHLEGVRAGLRLSRKRSLSAEDQAPAPAGGEARAGGAQSPGTSYRLEDLRPPAGGSEQPESPRRPTVLTLLDDDSPVRPARVPGRAPPAAAQRPARPHGPQGVPPDRSAGPDPPRHHRNRVPRSSLVQHGPLPSLRVHDGRHAPLEFASTHSTGARDSAAGAPGREAAKRPNKPVSHQQQQQQQPSAKGPLQSSDESDWLDSGAVEAGRGRLRGNKLAQLSKPRRQAGSSRPRNRVARAKPSARAPGGGRHLPQQQQRQRQQERDSLHQQQQLLLRREAECSAALDARPPSPLGGPLGGLPAAPQAPVPEPAALQPRKRHSSPQDPHVDDASRQAGTEGRSPMRQLQPASPRAPGSLLRGTRTTPPGMVTKPGGWVPRQSKVASREPHRAEERPSPAHNQRVAGPGRQEREPRVSPQGKSWGLAERPHLSLGQQPQPSSPHHRSSEPPCSEARCERVPDTPQGMAPAEGDMPPADTVPLRARLHSLRGDDDPCGTDSCPALPETDGALTDLGGAEAAQHGSVPGDDGLDGGTDSCPVLPETDLPADLEPRPWRRNPPREAEPGGTDSCPLLPETELPLRGHHRPAALLETLPELPATELSEDPAAPALRLEPPLHTKSARSARDAYPAAVPLHLRSGAYRGGRPIPAAEPVPRGDPVGGLVLQFQQQRVVSVVAAPGSRYAAVALEGGPTGPSVEVWELPEREERQPARLGSVCAVRCSPAGDPLGALLPAQLALVPTTRGCALLHLGCADPSAAPPGVLIHHFQAGGAAAPFSQARPLGGPLGGRTAGGRAPTVLAPSDDGFDDEVEPEELACLAAGAAGLQHVFAAGSSSVWHWVASPSWSSYTVLPGLPLPSGGPAGGPHRDVTALVPAGDLLLGAASSGAVLAWSLRTSRLVAQCPLPGDGPPLTLCPLGPRTSAADDGACPSPAAAVALTAWPGPPRGSEGLGTLVSLRLAGGLQVVESLCQQKAVHLATCGHLMAVCLRDGRVLVVEADTESILASLDFRGEGVAGLALTRCSKEAHFSLLIASERGVLYCLSLLSGSHPAK